MKTRAIVFSLFLAATAFTFTNCGGKKELNHMIMVVVMPMRTMMLPQLPMPLILNFLSMQHFNNNWQEYLRLMFGLKDAFVASDAAKVKAEAETTQKALAAADMKLLTGAAHNDWMAHLGSMESR